MSLKWTRKLNKSSMNNEHWKKKWSYHLENCQQGTKKLWDIVKTLTQTTTNSTPGISFYNKFIENPKKLANKFNAQFTPCASTKGTNEFRLRTLQKTPTDANLLIITVKTTATLTAQQSWLPRLLTPSGTTHWHDYPPRTQDWSRRWFSIWRATTTKKKKS